MMMILLILVVIVAYQVLGVGFDSLGSGFSRTSLISCLLAGCCDTTMRVLVFFLSWSVGAFLIPVGKGLGRGIEYMIMKILLRDIFFRVVITSLKLIVRGHQLCLQSKSPLHNTFNPLRLILGRQPINPSPAISMFLFPKVNTLCHNLLNSNPMSHVSSSHIKRSWSVGQDTHTKGLTQNRSCSGYFQDVVRRSQPACRCELP